MIEELLFIIDENDTSWAKEHLDHDSPSLSRSAVAVDIEGVRAAKDLDIQYNSYENLGWALDRNKASNMASRFALEWLNAQDVQQVLAPFLDHDGYPLLHMHFSLLRIGINLALESRMFMKMILNGTQPSRVLARQTEDLFYEEEYALGVRNARSEIDRLALKSLCENMNIEFTEKYAEQTNSIPNMDYVYSQPNHESVRIENPGSPTQKTILIFTWGGYHFDEVLETIKLLSEQHNVVVVLADQISEQQRRELAERNITLFNKYRLPVIEAQNIYADWVRRGCEASEALRSSTDLAKLFSDELGSYYKTLIHPLIHRELVKIVPGTVLCLARCEGLINKIKPDAVFSHFAVHPCETAQFLPARKRGIPSLTTAHGVNGFYNYVVADTFATESYAAWGEATSHMLNNMYTPSENKVAVAGSPRLDALRPTTKNKAELKKELGFDPKRSLCVFCDISSSPMNRFWRNSTQATIEGIASLSKKIPDAQFVYRIHHGTPMDAIAHSLKEAAPEICLQDSWSTPLSRILPAADVVIAHNASSCAEALLCGIPTIFLSALGNVEPLVLHYEAIPHVDSFTALPFVVRDVLQKNMQPSMVRKLAQPFFDDIIDGATGQSPTKLADLIAGLAQSESKPGFDDWIDRIDTASRCDFANTQFHGGQENLYAKWLSRNDKGKA